ncbi:MAG: PKD domain-containing protein, partial [Sphingobacteriales bacterium]
RLAYRATQIHWKLSAVPGLQPSVDSIVVNPQPTDSVWLNGRRYYTYTLRQDLVASAGDTLFIPFSYTAPDVDACNQTATGTIIVPLRPGPRVDFTVTGNRCLSDTLSFHGQILTTAGFTMSNFQWEFPDGSSAATLDARKRFTVAGANAVRFLAIASNGCSGDTTKLVTIDPSPIAKFGVSGRACTTDSLLFSDSSLIASGSIASWKWLMGEGTQLIRSSAAPFGFPYTVPGNYTVRLVATSAAGCVSDTVQQAITVQPRPQAAFTTDGNICLGDSIRFSDASTVSSGSIINRGWRFGDNTSLPNSNAVPFYHRYPGAGTYTVELRVVSAAGCVDSIAHPVTVAARPVASLSVSGVLCADSLLQFTSTTPQAGAQYYWDFGNGQTTTSAAAVATQAYGIRSNPFSVRHVVVLGPRCVSDTVLLTIPGIRPNPVAAFTIEADTFCTGKPIRFLADTTGVARWDWDFGNGTGTSVAPVTRIYTQGGDFIVRLTVKDHAGCGSAPATRSLRIGNTPQIDAGPDRYIQKGQSATLAASIPAGAFSISWSPAATLSSPTTITTVAFPDSNTTYTLFVIDNASGCTARDRVTVFTVGALYIPNAFTPNNDGRNDAWQIPGLAVYPNARVTVYNQWGEKVYDAANYTTQPWRGNALGVDLGNTTFVYMIQLNDAQKQVLKGTVTIIR